MNWDLIVVILIMALAVIVAIGIKVVLLLLAKKGLKHMSNDNNDTKPKD